MSNFFKSSLLGLTLTMALASCSYLPNSVTPDTTPTQPATNSLLKDNLTQCPPASSNSGDTMCTMQYDPVCVKVKTPTGFSTQTAGNACSACNVTGAVNYTKGECQ